MGTSCDDGVVMGTGHATYQGFILLRASSISSLISSMWANSNHLSLSLPTKYISNQKVSLAIKKFL